MADQPLFSIIIPFTGEQETLFTCLDAIYSNQSSISFETIVVQSGSTKILAKQLDKYGNLTLYYNQELLYPGKARNIGAEKSKSNILAFIDSDCLTCENWIDIAYSSLQSDTQILVGSIINANFLLPLASVDNLLQFVDFQKGRSSKSITHFPGTNFVIRKALFDKIGGFPNHLKVGEDVIFSQQAIKLAEGKICFNKNLIVKHKGRNTWPEFKAHQKVFGYYRGLLNLKIISPRILKKHDIIYSGYFALKRFIYIYFRTIQWNSKAILILIIYSPIIVLGLFYWTIGFYNGIKSKDKNRHAASI